MTKQQRHTRNKEAQRNNLHMSTGQDMYGQLHAPTNKSNDSNTVSFTEIYLFVEAITEVHDKSQWTQSCTTVMKCHMPYRIIRHIWQLTFQEHQTAQPSPLCGLLSDLC